MLKKWYYPVQRECYKNCKIESKKPERFCMKIAIVDYGAGNIQSIKFAIERLGYSANLTKEKEAIRNADKVIFPGVGEASSAMTKLRESGLHDSISTLKQPVLGICLGMQLMCNNTAEGNTNGLGIFDVDVVRFSNKVKVPQIGWNKIENLQSSLFKDLSEDFIYLVHSFYAPTCGATIASCYYDTEYSAALKQDNFYGTQFHPEKSGDYGSKILQNFLAL